MGAVLGALIVGLMAVAYLLGTANRSPVGSTGTSTGSGAVRPIDSTNSNNQAAPPAANAEPPRMTFDEFMALYNDPARRPVVLDVRTRAAYDKGHIRGAISVPEAEVDARVAEIPKDRLVVAYCQ